MTRFSPQKRSCRAASVTSAAAACGCAAMPASTRCTSRKRQVLASLLAPAPLSKAVSSIPIWPARTADGGRAPAGTAAPTGDPCCSALRRRQPLAFIGNVSSKRSTDRGCGLSLPTHHQPGVGDAAVPKAAWSQSPGSAPSRIEPRLAGRRRARCLYLGRPRSAARGRTAGDYRGQWHLGRRLQRRGARVGLVPWWSGRGAAGPGAALVRCRPQSQRGAGRRE